MSTQTKQLIDDFAQCKTMPVFMAGNNGNITPQIQYFLTRLIQWELNENDRSKAVLPSISCIAEHCTCTASEVKNALGNLHQEGYEVNYQDEHSMIHVTC